MKDVDSEREAFLRILGLVRTRNEQDEMLVAAGYVRAGENKRAWDYYWMVESCARRRGKVDSGLDLREVIRSCQESRELVETRLQALQPEWRCFIDVKTGKEVPPLEDPMPKTGRVKREAVKVENTAKRGKRRRITKNELKKTDLDRQLKHKGSNSRKAYTGDYIQLV